MQPWGRRSLSSSKIDALRLRALAITSAFVLWVTLSGSTELAAQQVPPSGELPSAYGESPWPSDVPPIISNDSPPMPVAPQWDPIDPEQVFTFNQPVDPYGAITSAPRYPGVGEPAPDPPLDPRTLERMTELARPDPLAFEAPFFYRANSSSSRLVARGQAGFADVSWESDPYLEPNEHGGFGFGSAFRLLEGPLNPDLNPRLFDLQMGYQHRAMFLNGWSFDVAGTIGAFTDFEDSIRDGIRFPGHAVLSGELGPRVKWVAGGEYLDRDDLSWLPVGGLRMEPHPDLQIHAEFPRPMIRWLREDGGAYYVRGELGGGTWDIEHDQSGIDDVVTVREVNIFFGTESVTDQGLHGFEIGYSTGRRLEFRAGADAMDLPDAWLFRWVDRF